MSMPMICLWFALFCTVHKQTLSMHIHFVLSSSDCVMLIKCELKHVKVPSVSLSFLSFFSFLLKLLVR